MPLRVVRFDNLLLDEVSTAVLKKIEHTQDVAALAVVRQADRGLSTHAVALKLSY